MEMLRRTGLYSATWMGADKTDRRIFLWVMLLHVAVMLVYNQWQSPACDESSYFSYALRWAKGMPERTDILDDSKTPVVAPALWSLVLRPLMPSLSYNNGEALLQLGRLAMYGYFLLLSFGFFCWSCRLFGSRKWIFPWVIFLCDPLLNANAMLIGSDTASACCWLWAAYLAWRFAQTQSLRYWWWLSLVCGMALLVKPSMVFILPMVAVLLLWVRFGKTNQPAAGGFKILLIRYGGMAIICLFIINAGYYFSGTGKALSTLPARSKKLSDFQQNHPRLSAVPLPVPQPYISAYDLLYRNAEQGGGHTGANSYHGVFLNGQYKATGGFKSYYAWQFFYKITPLLLLCLAGSLLMLFYRSGSLKNGETLRIFAWLPPLFFGLLLSFTNPFQIGIRHALPAWPFLYLLAGYFIVFAATKRLKIMVVAFALQLAEIAQVWPNLTAYTPAWMQPKATLYRRVFDSGLFYCNDAKIYRNFLANHPEYKVPATEPAPGKFALRLNECNTIMADNGPLGCWLLQHFKPNGHYKSSILLFDITPEQVSELTTVTGPGWHQH